MTLSAHIGNQSQGSCGFTSIKPPAATDRRGDPWLRKRHVKDVIVGMQSCRNVSTHLALYGPVFPQRRVMFICLTARGGELGERIGRETWLASQCTRPVQWGDMERLSVGCAVSCVEPPVWSAGHCHAPDNQLQHYVYICGHFNLFRA